MIFKLVALLGFSILWPGISPASSPSLWADATSREMASPWWERIRTAPACGWELRRRWCRRSLPFPDTHLRWSKCFRWSRGLRGQSRAVTRSALNVTVAGSGTPGLTGIWPSLAASWSRCQHLWPCLYQQLYQMHERELIPVCMNVHVQYERSFCVLDEITSFILPFSCLSVWAEWHQAGSPAGPRSQAGAQDPSLGHSPAERHQRLVRPQQGEPPVSEKNEPLGEVVELKNSCTSQPVPVVYRQGHMTK